MERSYRKEVIVCGVSMRPCFLYPPWLPQTWEALTKTSQQHQTQNCTLKNARTWGSSSVQHTWRARENLVSRLNGDKWGYDMAWTGHYSTYIYLPSQPLSLNPETRNPKPCATCFLSARNPVRKDLSSGLAPMR